VRQDEANGGGGCEEWLNLRRNEKAVQGIKRRKVRRAAQYSRKAKWTQEEINPPTSTEFKKLKRQLDRKVTTANRVISGTPEEGRWAVTSRLPDHPLDQKNDGILSSKSAGKSAPPKN